MFRHRACLGGSTAFALLVSWAIQVAQQPMNPWGKPRGERFTTPQPSALDIRNCPIGVPAEYFIGRPIGVITSLA